MADPESSLKGFVAMVLRQLAGRAVDTALAAFRPGEVHAVTILYTRDGDARGVCGSDTDRARCASMLEQVAAELRDPSTPLSSSPFVQTNKDTTH